MSKFIKFSSLAISLVLFTGCGGSVAELAQKVLYPFEQVNKKYPVPENPPPGFKSHTFDVTAQDGTKMAIHAWSHRNSNPNARVFVYLHGNGENLQALFQFNMLTAIANMGVHFIVIDYPGLGRSTGTPSEYNLVHSAVAAIDWADAEYPNSTLILWGRSLGAGVANQAVLHRQDRINGLVLTSPWTNFYDAARSQSSLADSIPQDWLAKNRYDSVGAASQIRVTTLVHHGLLDRLIPIVLGRRFFAAFSDPSQAHFVEIADKEHNDIFTSPILWQDVKAFIR